MPLVQEVEALIRDLEGFDVVFRHPRGKRVRRDANVPAFRYSKASPKAWTVDEWKNKKFLWVYPNYDCDVFFGDGEPVRFGQTKVNTVRITYS